MNEFYLVLIAALGGLLTKGTEWVFTRKSTTEDIKGKEIDNEIKLSDAYVKMLDDLQPRYQAKYDDLEKLYEGKVRILKDEIALLNRNNKMLKAENIQLKKRIKELESQNENTISFKQPNAI